MSNSLDRSLHGVAIYNPRLLSKDELIGFFVARQVELERLVEALRREAKSQPQHHLVVGARGMGKTTLLHRLRYAIDDDEELASRCIGVVFPEEQYNVVCLADFWLNCVDALADGLETAGRMGLLEGLDEEVVRVQALPRKDDRGRRALELLCKLSDRLQRRLILLVDNVNLVLDRLEDEQWALREVLSSEPRIQLIGATSAPLESQYRHDKAFYDFFRVHHLDGLDDEATFTVLRRLAEATGHDRVAQLLDDEPGRVKTVRLMAGGNPRTLVLLFSVLAQGTDGDVRTDIERILDQSTPLYKHRLEALSMQAQQMLDALAKHWAPATANEIADATHLPVNVVSAQLDRLVRDGTVEKVSLPDTKRQGFQIAERFFNTWCLMRASRRVRRRLAWLVEFLRLMFGAEELARRARLHSAAGGPRDVSRHAELGVALADVVEHATLRTALASAAAAHLGFEAVDSSWPDSEARESHSILPSLVWAEQALSRGVSADEISESILLVIRGHERNQSSLALVGLFLRDHPELFADIELAYDRLMSAQTHAFILIIAWFNALGSNWSKASEWFTFAFTDRHTRFIDESWTEVLEFFFIAVVKGFVSEARALLAELGATERWEALDHALVILEIRDPTALERLSPEMREAVRLVLARISPQTLAESTPPVSRRRRRATKKS